MRIQDYMSATAITISSDADYSAAFEIMEDKDLHHLPVVNGAKEVVGLITRRDLQLAARFFKEAPAEVSEVMHSPVLTISSKADLSEAVELMMEKRIGCLPVTNDGKHLVGMITETDLFRALQKLLAAA